MQIPIISRQRAIHRPGATPSMLLSQARRAVRRMLAEPVVGNPLHEAWTADGEPIERMSPVAQRRPARRLAVTINGHSR